MIKNKEIDSRSVDDDDVVSNMAIIHSPFAPRIDWRSSGNSKAKNMN